MRSQVQILPLQLNPPAWQVHTCPAGFFFFQAKDGERPPLRNRGQARLCRRAHQRRIGNSGIPAALDGTVPARRRRQFLSRCNSCNRSRPWWQTRCFWSSDLSSGPASRCISNRTEHAHRPPAARLYARTKFVGPALRWRSFDDFVLRVFVASQRLCLNKRGNRENKKRFVGSVFGSGK